jgi:predicted MPP superfamily phosphohydrolase
MLFDWDIRKFLSDPLEEAAHMAAWLGRRWSAALGLPLALFWLTLRRLPARAERQGAPQRAGLLREMGAQALAWTGADLGLTAALPALRLSYAPVRGAFFFLFCIRAALTLGGVGLAQGAALGRRDLGPAGRARLARLIATAHAALGLFIVYATYFEANRLGVSRYRLRRPGRTAGAPPLRLRLAQISDIHMERMTRRDEAAVALLRAARPDLILLTGDFINIDYYDVRAYEDLRALLTAIGALAPRLGAYACLGNVDPPELVATIMQGTGVCLLDDTAVTLPVCGRTVQVLGAQTSRGHRWEFDLPHLRRAIAVAEAQGPADLRVLLYHTPDMAPQAAEAGVDLYVCGHTHGGQIRLPFLGALRTGSRFGRRYVMGLNRLANGGYIYTNRGAGFEGMRLPRLRVLCPPEVAVFDVTVGDPEPVTAAAS